MVHHFLLSTFLLAPAFANPLRNPFTEPSESTPLPLVIWHGLGDNYKAEGLRSVGDLAIAANPGTYVYYVRLHEDPGTDSRATFLGNLTEQIAQVCNDIAAHPILSTAPAINALGFSQGGQFLRGYVERCNNPPVRNLVTFGSQHNGIAKYQNCKEGDWLCKSWVALLRTNTWSGYVQSQVVPAQYFRATEEGTGEPTDDYLQYSNFLADVNNERKLKNVTYAKNLASLDKFVMYVFEDDTTVIPKESAWFAQVNVTSGEVTKLQDRKIYKEDWIGLKQLDQKGGLEFKTVPGPHMQLTNEDLNKVFKTYFAPPKATWRKVVDEVEELLEL